MMWLIVVVQRRQRMSLINYDVPINFLGQNGNIVVNKNVMVDKLLECGFKEGKSYGLYTFTSWLDDSTTFVVDIKNLTYIEFLVIDDDFGQPYDYQGILQKSDDTNEIALAIHKKVQDIMLYFIVNEIIDGYNLGDYI